MRTAQNGDVELLRLRAACFFALGDLENSVKHLQQALRWAMVMMMMMNTIVVVVVVVVMMDDDDVNKDG